MKGIFAERPFATNNKLGERKMPYDSIDDLPDNVKDNLPKEAQKIYKEAYNASYDEHPDWDDARRAKYAWGAVKNVYEKNDDGEWVKKTKNAAGVPKSDAERAMDHFGITKDTWDNLSDEEKKEYIDKLPPRGAKLARHYFQISNEIWDNLKPEVQEIFMEEAEIKEPSTEDKLDWLNQDITNLYATVYDHYEDAQEKFDRINQRINDIIGLVGGRANISAEAKLADGENSEGTFTYKLEDLEWTKLEAQNVYKISGCLIAEGTWTGIDGHTVFYPREVIQESYSEAIGKAYKRGHGDKDDDVIGFITAAAFKEDRAMFEAIVFDAQTIEDIGLGNITGTSMEALVQTKWDEEKGYHIAQSMKLLKATAVEKPACKKCDDLSLTGPVALEDDNGDVDMSKETDNGSDQTPVLDLAKLSEDGFLDKVESELMNTELGRTPTQEFMSVVRGIARISDKISRMRFENDDEPDEGDSAQISAGNLLYYNENEEQYLVNNSNLEYNITDNSISLSTTDNSNIWDPWTTDYTTFPMEIDLEDGNKITKFDSDKGDKEMSTELEEIKAELAEVSGKLGELESEKADYETKLEDAESKISELEAELEGKDEAIADKDGVIAALSKELEDIKEAEVVALTEQITEIQEDFDAEALLEDVESLDLQKKMLTSYLETASKMKKKTKLQVNDEGELEKRVGAMLSEMGISDLKSFMEQR